MEHRHPSSQSSCLSGELFPVNQTVKRRRVLKQGFNSEPCPVRLCVEGSERVSQTLEALDDRGNVLLVGPIHDVLLELKVLYPQIYRLPLR